MDIIDTLLNKKTIKQRGASVRNCEVGNQYGSRDHANTANKPRVPLGILEINKTFKKSNIKKNGGIRHDELKLKTGENTDTSIFDIKNGFTKVVKKKQSSVEKLHQKNLKYTQKYGQSGELANNQNDSVPIDQYHYNVVRFPRLQVDPSKQKTPLVRALVKHLSHIEINSKLDDGIHKSIKYDISLNVFCVLNVSPNFIIVRHFDNKIYYLQHRNSQAMSSFTPNLKKIEISTKYCLTIGENIFWCIKWRYY